MATLEVKRVLSSPALRCVKLAERIATLHSLDFEVCDELRERDYGVLVNKSGSEIYALGLKRRPIGGESVIDVYNRATNFYSSSDLGEKTAIISHGLFLKMLAAQFLDLTPSHAAKVLKFSNCGISELKPNLIEFMNDRSHLGKDIKRIHIFGCWASGKSTLADKLGDQFGLPVYHLDDLKYKNCFTKERSVEERISLLEEITYKESWITEGTWTSYAKSAFHQADFLIYNNVSKRTALSRAQKREEERNENLELSHNHLLEEIIRYYDTKQEVSKATHDSYFKKYSGKATQTLDLDFHKLTFLEDLWDFVDKRL